MQSAGIFEDPSHCEESYKISQEITLAMNGYLLCNNEVFKFPPLVGLGINQIQCISCNSSLALANNSQGQVFGWGEDNYGLLGFGPQSYFSPIRVENIQNIAKCSLGTDHAAAIDMAGLLFTWSPFKDPKLGDVIFEECVPKSVQSAKHYKIVDVTCGDTYTCIRTDGCYLQVYGFIGKNHQAKLNFSPRKSITMSQINKGPFSNPRLDTETVVQVLGCKEFIAARLEGGDVYVFDSCMQLFMLNPKGKSVDHIVGNDRCIWGINKNEVITWNRNQNLGGPLECPLKNWESNEYNALEKYSVWEWGDRFLVVSPISEVFRKIPKENQLKVVIHKSYSLSPLDSPCIPIKDRFSPRASFESLQRLFSKGDNEKLIEKIMKCRAEFSNRGTLLEAFKGLVHPIIRDAICQIKKYCEMKRVYFLYINSIRIFGICEKYVLRRISNKFYHWIRVITFEKYSKWRNSKFDQRFSRSYLKFRNSLILKLYNLVEKKIYKCQRKGFKHFKTFYRVNTKRDKALVRLLNILQNINATYYFSIWKHKQETYLIRKGILEALAEVLRNQIQFVTFETLLNQGLRSNKIRKFFKFGFIKLIGIIRFNEMKRTIKSLEKLVSNIANKNAKHQIAYNSFPRILNLKLSKILSNSLHNFFQFLGSKSNFKGKSWKMFLTLRKVSKRFNSTIFKRLLPKSYFSNKSLLKLCKLLANKSQNALSKILSVSRQKSSRILSSFFLTLNTIKARKHFWLKLSSIGSIKDHCGYPHQTSIYEFYDGLQLESLNQSSDRSSSKSANNIPYLLTVPSLNLAKSESSLNNLQINDEKNEESECLNRTHRSNISNQEPTSFHSGELLRYQQYLINKKRLAMIQEDYSGSENGIKNTAHNQSTKHFKRKYKKKKEKKEKVKPPWRPSSISANFTYRKQSTPALVKSMQYYEKLLEKQERGVNIIHKKEMTENNPSICFKDSSLLDSINNEKNPLSTLLKRQDSDSPTIYFSSNSIIDIGLGSILLEKIFRKVQKKHISFAVRKCSLMRKKHISLVATKDKLIKSSWKTAVILIGIGKLKRIIKKSYLRIVYK